jgi:predicted nucleic acid-binding protein
MFLADTSLIVSPFAKTPKRRVWAQKFFKEQSQHLYTTVAAFTEASHLIGDCEIVAKIINDYHFVLDVEEEKHALAALLEKYAPEMDFADATLVRASELFPSYKIVTNDSHFKWYRRNREQKLPVVWIPE